MYCVNEDDNDEWEGDDLEGGEDGRDNNDDEGDQCGYLPVQSRCSGTVMAPLLSLTVANYLSLKDIRIGAHTRTHFMLAHTNTVYSSFIGSLP